MNLLVFGGGAAGFFAALSAKSSNPSANVIILEKTAKLLSKVRISGGGRCNVTHACFQARDLVSFYPRGHRELLGPFHVFQPRDTIQWFSERGVELKVESDGRMFPVTDSSSTIIDCLSREAEKLGVEIRTQQKIEKLVKDEDGFQCILKDGETLKADAVILATGSNKAGHEFAQELGHSINTPVPSLFTFNIPSFPLVDLAGASVQKVRVYLEGTKLKEEGPVLITHWGFSGPAVLKLSAWGARELHSRDYKISVRFDWLADYSIEDIYQILEDEKQNNPSKLLSSIRLFPIPKKLWKRFLERSDLNPDLRISTLGKKGMRKLCSTLKEDRYKMSGKTTHKEEFVTCGGVKLSEINFKKMESQKCPGLYFAGELMDIDGVTGGFNFQNAWTSGWIAGRSAVTSNGT
ncbi:MAG: aminoacetone oxidase family FAD-binding enzyme [Waddliaceae bacterium]|nr:aminoacetone oxidase family FAD-binding enzyme [Waddliaceae bacterium]